MKDHTGARKVCVGGECAATCPVFALGGICMSPAEVARYLAAKKQMMAELTTIVGEA